MEIKARLNKPYTEQKKERFIAEYGQDCFGKYHTNYEIRETETQLQAWGYTQSELLEQAKIRKQENNICACKNKRYSQEFMLTLQDKECLFDTTKGTEDDLKTAFLYCTATQETYNDWVCNNYVVINLTLDDIIQIQARMRMLSSPLYLVQKRYYEQIMACTTVEEVEAIVLNYDINIIDYTQYTVVQLKAMADERGINYPSNILKADLIALLENN